MNISKFFFNKISFLFFKSIYKKFILEYILLFLVSFVMFVSISLINGLQVKQINSLKNYYSYPLIIKNVLKDKANDIKDKLDKNYYVQSVSLYKKSDLFKGWAITKGESGAVVLKEIDNNLEDPLYWTGVVDIGIRYDENYKNDILKIVSDYGDFTTSSYIEENKDFYDALRVEKFVLKLVFIVLFLIMFLSFIKNISFVYSAVHQNLVFFNISSLSKREIFYLLFNTSIIPNIVFIILGNILGILFTNISSFKNIIFNLIFQNDHYFSVDFYTPYFQMIIINLFIIIMFVIMLLRCIKKQLTLDISELYNDRN